MTFSSVGCVEEKEKKIEVRTRIIYCKTIARNLGGSLETTRKYKLFLTSVLRTTDLVHPFVSLRCSSITALKSSRTQ